MRKSPIDAFLLLSFGGPEGKDDVLPFLRNVVAGRGVPDERLAEVAEHYYHFGGVSPINQQNRDLLKAIDAEFADRGMAIPIYWGNRNWHPMLADTLTRMRDDGVRHAVAFATAAYSSYSACRQYLEDITQARAHVPGAPEVSKIGPYYAHPGFRASHVEALRTAFEEIPLANRATTRLVFCAHSIPVVMNNLAGRHGGGYERQLRETAAAITAQVAAGQQWDLVWQSRSGSPRVPWLEPDINDYISALKDVSDVVLSPIGFVSDHLEVKWDLDNEAAATARDNGINLVRAATPGTHPRFVAMIADLVAMAQEEVPTACVPGCCPAR